MSGPETSPGEAAHLRQPPVVFECANIAGLERLAWTDATNQLILDEFDLPEPIDHMSGVVDGSSNPDGEFGFSTVMTLKEGSGDDVAEALDRVAAAHQSVARFVGPNQYIYGHPDGRKHSVEMDSERRSVTVHTLGASLDEEGMWEWSELRHGVDDFRDSFDDFIDFNRELLREVYGALGLQPERVQLWCEPVTSVVTDVREQEEPEPMVRLDDLAGYPVIKQQIQDLADEMRAAARLEEWGVKRRQGLLLYGPPGVGKTTFVEAFANEIGAQFKVVKSDQIYDMWLGNSEKNMNEVFDEAVKAKGPYVLLFDELESIISSKDGHSAHQHVAGIYKQRSARLTQENPNVIQAATTNDTNRSDPAILRSGRFDVRLEVPLPDRSGRSEIFALYVGKVEERSRYPVFDDVDFGRLADATTGYSGADIEAAVKGVVIGRALHHMRTNEVKPPATTGEILAAISGKEDGDPDHARFDRPGNYL